MAQRKPKQQSAPAPGVGSELLSDIDADPVETAEEFELEKFLEEHGEGIARVTVLRVGAKGILEKVDTVGTDGLTPEMLRETYGAPATYVLRFKGADGRYRAQARIVLGALKVGEAAAVTGSGVSGSSNATVDLLKIQIDMMNQRSAEQAQMINTLLAGIVNRPAATAPAGDPATMLTALVTAFSTLQSAVVKTAPEDPIEKFKSMFTLVKELLPGGPAADVPTEDNPWSVVKEIGARAVDMARPFIERAAAGAIIPQTTNQPGTPTHAALPAATGEATVKTPLQWVKEGLDYLKEKAKANKDPEMFIEYILENGEEMRFAAIIGAVKQGVTFEQLLQFDAEIAQNPTLTEWFKDVFDGIFAELFPDGNAKVDSGGKGGNTGDVASDGVASAAGPGQSSDKVASKSD
jgi:hypothetical protein